MKLPECTSASYDAQMENGADGRLSMKIEAWDFHLFRSECTAGEARELDRLED